MKMIESLDNAKLGIPKIARTSGRCWKHEKGRDDYTLQLIHAAYGSLNITDNKST